MDTIKTLDAGAIVIKLSASNIEDSLDFYTGLFGWTVDDRYTLNAGGVYGTFSYVQLNPPGLRGNISFGLFKDIEAPLPAPDLNNPPPGTAPTFLVTDIAITRAWLMECGIPVSDVVKNTSDEGYTDCFAFFADPDNNLLVIRENII